MPSGTADVHIGDILYDTPPMTDFYYTLTPQNGGSSKASLLVEMKADGAINVIYPCPLMYIDRHGSCGLPLTPLNEAHHRRTC